MSSLEKDPYVDAAERGQTVVLPADDELFIDIDSEEDGQHMLDMLGVLEENGWTIDHAVLRVTTSRTKWPHRHVYLKAPRALMPLERITLQACLGSDRKRELLSFLRIEQKADRPPTVFFE